MKNRLIEIFREKYDKEPEVLAFAPGRVNIIGEHTDYNEGFVLPAALKQGTYIAGKKIPEPIIRIYSANLDEQEEWKTGEEKRTGGFGDYLKGILKFLPFRLSSGFEAVIFSDLPIEAGLSSSAALEVSFIYFLMGIEGKELERLQIVKLAHRAENEFVGVQCGIMDQFISVYAQEGHFLFLDTLTTEYKHVPFPKFWTLAVVNSGIKRELSSSDYNRRREECQEALYAIKKLYPDANTLRDVTEEMLFSARNLMSETIFKRAMHIISENQRVLQMVEYLEKRDSCMIEKLMKLAHQSLTEDFEVSLPELDFLVETASSMPFVHGARLTGAGFGGSIVALVEKRREEEFLAKIREEYTKKYSIEPEIIFSPPSSGAYLQKIT